MNDVAISVQGLVKSYGTNLAVNGLDLTIRHGEVFALLGPNGAGKSTTVEILEGFRKRSGGDVRVLGVDPEKPTNEWREKLGIVLQSTQEGHASLLTVRESLEYQHALFPNSREVDEVIASVGLEASADKRADQLSGGQRRRLEVGLAVIGRPALVFLDEPTTGFDPEARRQFWALLTSLKGEGTTIVLTTHYLDEADALADRIAVIAQGNLVALDTPHGLRSRAESTTVAWTENGERHSQQTSKPSELLREILSRTTGEIDNLEVRTPSLEDVYLELLQAHDINSAVSADLKEGENA